ATMEVEAVDEGVIDQILVAEGSQGVKVNTPIATLKGDGAPAAKPTPAPKAQPQPSAQPTQTARAPAAAAVSQDGGGRSFASPLAKRLAAQGGIDLSGLKGTGPNGRVVKRDIEAALASPRPPAAEPSRALARQEITPTPAPHRSLEQMGVKTGTYDLVPLDLMRKTIAKRMT